MVYKALHDLAPTYLILSPPPLPTSLTSSLPTFRLNSHSTYHYLIWLSSFISLTPPEWQYLNSRDFLSFVYHIIQPDWDMGIRAAPSWTEGQSWLRPPVFCGDSALSQGLLLVFSSHNLSTEGTSLLAEALMPWLESPVQTWTEVVIADMRKGKTFSFSILCLYRWDANRKDSWWNKFYEWNLNGKAFKRNANVILQKSQARDKPWM